MTIPHTPEVERMGGLECYATSSPPCSAKVRSVDEDFQVEEVLNEEVKPSPEPFSHCYPLYRVEKRSMDTFHLEAELSSVFGRRVRYAGIKDKRALAVQFVTPVGTKASVERLVEGHGYRCELLGYLPRPISGSMISGNRFRITLRDCCPSVGDCVVEALKVCEEKRMPNFFGLQRFGVREVRTSRIGRSLVKCEFEKATAVLLWEPRLDDDENTARARELMRAGRFDVGGVRLPQGQDTEKIVARSLAKNGGDFVAALRSIPLALRRFYVQAYQAFLFNRTLSAALRKGLDISTAERGDNWADTSDGGMILGKIHGVREPMSQGAVPLIQLVGYAYRNYGSRFDVCTEEVLRDEGVAASEFYVKQMQEVSAEGGFRRTHMSVGDATWSPGARDAVRLMFTLPRGEYATVLLREIIKPQDPAASGFG